MDILNSLKKQVTFDHIEGDGVLLDMGMSAEEVASLKQRNPVLIPPESRRRLAEFKPKFHDGDELWYYQWRSDAFCGTGGYAIICAGAVVASLTSWRS